MPQIHLTTKLHGNYPGPYRNSPRGRPSPAMGSDVREPGLEGPVVAADAWPAKPEIVEPSVLTCPITQTMCRDHSWKRVEVSASCCLQKKRAMMFRRAFKTKVPRPGLRAGERQHLRTPRAGAVLGDLRAAEGPVDEHRAAAADGVHQLGHPPGGPSALPREPNTP